MADDGKSGLTLPYGAWKTAKNFLERLKQSAIPPQIDNSVMVNMSGSGKSELRATLRFFGLVDASDSVLPPLKKLVDAYGTDSWVEELQDRLLASYSGVIGDNPSWLDVGTAQQLRDRFRAAGADGEMLEKAIRFFLAAAADGGMSLSPYFSIRGARSVGPRSSSAKRSSPKRTKQEGEGAAEKHPVHRDPEPAAGTARYPFAIPGKGSVVITVPDALTADEWEMVNNYVVGMLRLTKKK